MKASTAEHGIKRVHLYTVAVIIVAAVHFGSVFAPFHFDDSGGVIQNTSVRDLKYFSRYWVDPYLFSAKPDTAMYRPVTLTSYLANYLCCGYRPMGWHLTSLCIHLINVFLVMVFARRFLQSDWPAFFVGLIYGCHPVGVETVGYISARSGLLATLFALCAVLAAAEYVSDGRRRILWAALSVVLFALALSSKENVAPLPVMAFLFGYISGDVRERRQWWITAAMWFFVLAIYITWRRWGLMLDTMPTHSERPMGTNLLTQSSVVVHYIRLLIWPWGQSVVYGLKRVGGFFESPLSGMLSPLAAILLLAGMVSGLLAVHKKFPVLFIGMCWFFIMLVPESVLPLNQIANDRRLYFPMIGLIIAVVSLVAPLLEGRRRAWIALPVITVILLSILSIQRVRVWNSNLALWTDAVKKSPLTPATWQNLGQQYLDVDIVDKGIKTLWMAYLLKPEDPVLMNNVGVAMEKNGRLEDAAGIFNLLMKKYPDYPRGWYNLGILSHKLGRYDDAEAAFQALIDLVPEHAAGHLNLGSTLYSRGDLEGARKKYLESLKIDPDLQEAKHNLRVVERELSDKKR